MLKELGRITVGSRADAYSQPNSRHCCAKLQNEPATGSGGASVRFSTSSLQRSATTTSELPAIATHCENALEQEDRYAPRSSRSLHGQRRPAMPEAVEKHLI